MWARDGCAVCGGKGVGSAPDSACRGTNDACGDKGAGGANGNYDGPEADDVRSRPYGGAHTYYGEGKAGHRVGHVLVGPVGAPVKTMVPVTRSQEAAMAWTVAMAATKLNEVMLVATEATVMVSKSVGGGVAMTKARVEVDLSRSGSKWRIRTRSGLVGWI
jgi:hypothetical protein